MFSKTKPITPWPFAIYLSTLAILIFVGLGDSIYLSISHYRAYTDIEYKSFCALSKSFNCDTVSQSPYSIFWGMPVPVWGVIGYAFLCLLLPFTVSRDAAKKRIWPLIFWISLIFVIISVALAFISTYYVGSYCIMCIISYGINLFLLLYSWIINKRFSTSGLVKGLKEDFFFLCQKKWQSLLLIASFLVGISILNFILPAYWNLKPAAIIATLPSGITSDGHPWIGAEKPQIEITEFTDYQCFQCKKMHYFLRNLIAENPDKIRLIHRNFPMDNKLNPIVKEPFHVGSAAMALMAIATIPKERFWQINDELYQTDLKKGELDVREIAEKAGIDYHVLTRGMTNKRYIKILIEDIRQGLKLGVNGTPAFFIEGKLYLGQIPAELLEKALR